MTTSCGTHIEVLVRAQVHPYQVRVLVAVYSTSTSVCSIAYKNMRYLLGSLVLLLQQPDEKTSRVLCVPGTLQYLGHKYQVLYTCTWALNRLL